jgi:hypothetical protein
MKKICLLFIAIFFHFLVSAEEIFKDIELGRIFVVDGEGCIFVDSGSHSIAKYSPSGKLLLEMGQKGEGPSDIKRLGWFAICPIDKSIYVTEMAGGNRWISKFSTDGRYLGELNCEIDWTKWHGTSFIQFDRKGDIYLQLERSIPRRCKDFTIGTIEKKLVKFSPKGKKLKEIFSMKTDFWAEKRGKGNITIPFHNYLYWNVYKDRVIVRESKNKFINLFDLEGNLQKKISAPFEKEKVTREDIDKWEERIKTSRWGKEGIANGWLDLNYWKKRLPFPEHKPISGDQMFIDSQGNLYNMKYQGHYSKPIVCARINLLTNKVTIFNFNQWERLLGIWKNYFFIMKWDGKEKYVVSKMDEKEFLKRTLK